MKAATRARPVLAALLAAGLLSCAGAPPTRPAAPLLAAQDEAAVRAAVARRAEAVATGDKDLFMSLIATGDPAFALERSRWFDYRLSAEIDGYSLEVEDIRPEGPDECSVALRLEYRIGPGREARATRFVERYRRAAGTWLDADLRLVELASEHFALGYQEGIDELRARTVLAYAESAWLAVRGSFGEAPAGRTRLKLYADRELLRQDTKITIGRLFSGWAEPGESIKLWLRPDPGYSYAPLVAHELVHAVTLEIAAGQCSWFAEGLANHFGNFAVAGADHLQSGYHSPADYGRGLGWLGATDPEAVASDAEWAVYGGMAGSAIRFLRERYGWRAPRLLLEELGGSGAPRSEGYVYAKHDARYRESLDEALRKVLGVGPLELEESWEDWLALQPDRGR